MADVRREIELVLRARDESMSKGLNSTTSALKGMESGISKLRGMLLALAPALGAAALVKFAKDAIDAGSALHDMSVRLGVSVQALSEFKYIADQNGIALADVGQALRFMQVNAAAGTDAFKLLTKEMGDLKALKPDELFQKIVERIAEIPDQNERMAAAVAIFGRGGAAMLQMADNLGAAREEARALGVTMTDEMASKLDAAGDATDRLSFKLKGIMALMASDLSPAIIDVAAVLGGLARAMTDDVKNNVFTEIKRSLEEARASMKVPFYPTPDTKEPPQPGPIGRPRGDRGFHIPEPPKASAKEDGSVWWEDLPDASKIIAEAWEKAHDQQDMLREGAEQHAEQIDEMLRAMEDTAQAQADAADEAKRMREELTRARIEAVDGMVSGVLQLAGATGSATQRWAQGLAKVQAVYRSILAVAQAIAALRIIGAAASGGSSEVGGSGAVLEWMARGGTVRGAAGFRVTGGSPGRDSVRAMLMPDETVISRDMTRQLARFLGRSEAGYISPFALAGAGAGGGGNVTLQVARPIGRLDGLDLGAAAHAAQREFRRRFVE